MLLDRSSPVCGNRHAASSVQPQCSTLPRHRRQLLIDIGTASGSSGSDIGPDMDSMDLAEEMMGSEVPVMPGTIRPPALVAE